MLDGEGVSERGCVCVEGGVGGSAGGLMMGWGCD